MRYRDPILRGFHPDPSICRVEEGSYMATSSLTYQPGAPVFHGRSLTDRSLARHCLTRDSQIWLEERRNSRGISVPILRHHKSRFYTTTMDVDGTGNFIVYSPPIDGPWSDPVAADQNGIDPSPLWGEDGTYWYYGKGSLEGKRGVIAFVLGPLVGEILLDKYVVSKDCGGKCVKGPHVYRRDGWYYLLITRDGTQYSHRAMI